MNIIDKLNSGELHAVARINRPNCVDHLGNIHVSAERAAFVDWVSENGKDHPEFSARYVPSH
jgi:hypothetical protein